MIVEYVELHYGVTENVIRRVLSLQNAATHVITAFTGARRRDHIMLVLCQLHWLPVRRRVQFKTSNSPVWCAMQALCGQMPTYLADDIHLISEGIRRSLWSSSVWCHVCITASETKALVLPVHEFGTVCHVAYEHLTSATNILKHY